MRRTTVLTGIVLAGGLLLVGCASGGGGGGATEAAGGDCEIVRAEGRDISNGAQNTLVSETDPEELSDYLDGLTERVTELQGEVENEEVVSALDDFSASIESAKEYAATLPTPDPNAEEEPEVDAEAQAAAQEEIQSSYVSVTTVACESAE